jgi:hypothetical protein
LCPRRKMVKGNARLVWVYKRMKLSVQRRKSRNRQISVEFNKILLLFLNSHGDRTDVTRVGVHVRRVLR